MVVISSNRYDESLAIADVKCIIIPRNGISRCFLIFNSEDFILMHKRFVINIKLLDLLKNKFKTVKYN
jgi:hypothetical protein